MKTYNEITTELMHRFKLCTFSETKRKCNGKRMLKIIVPGGMWHTIDMIAIFLNNVPLIFGAVNYKVLYSSKQTNTFLIAEI